MSDTVRLGYIGLGNIGGPMASRLAAWQGGLTVFDISEEAVTALVDRGARAATSPADLATKADLIGVCVLDDAQARTVITGDDGLLSTAAPGTIVAVHSTIAPETAADLAVAAAEVGVTILDAPISGGAMGAEQGRLAVMVGGDRDAYRTLKEPYAMVAEMLVHAGSEVGAGITMKLARNLLHFVSFAATAEASRLAEAAGIDITKLGKVVRHTDSVTGGPGAIMVRDTTDEISPDDVWYGVFAPVRTLGEKDLSLALDAADRLDVDLPLARIAVRQLASALGVPHHEGDA